MKKLGEKILSILMVFTVMFSYLVPVSVLATVPANTGTYARIDIGGNPTSVADVSNGNSVVVTYPNGTVTVTGTNLYSDTTIHDGGIAYIYTTGTSATVTATPNANYSATLWQNGTNLNTTTTNLTGLSNSGPGPRVDADFYTTAPGTNNNSTCTGTNCATATLNYTANGVEPADIIINGTEVAVGNPPTNPISYNYDVTDDPGTVTFNFGILFISRLTSIKINNVEYYNNNTVSKAELLNRFGGQRFNYEVEVPKADTYNVVTEAVQTERELMPIGNFLWTYNPLEIGTDDSVYGGKLEFVSLKYNDKTYNSLAELRAENKEYLDWNESIVTDSDPLGLTGGAVLPADAELTVKLIPDAGYQLVSFGVNGGTFDAGEEIGVYTFKVGKGNFHLAAKFKKVDDAVESSTKKIVSGSITLGDESSMTNGTAKLTIGDVNNLTDEQKSKFEKEAGSYKISNYLNISLYNTVYKGSPDDAWDTKVTDLDGEATITLKLDEGVDGNSVVLVHEHNGEYEVIPTTYDPETHTITFKTKGFSNYAIAVKNDTKNPNTSDNISKQFIILIISIVGYLVTELLRKIKIKTSM